MLMYCFILVEDTEEEVMEEEVPKKKRKLPIVIIIPLCTYAGLQIFFKTGGPKRPMEQNRSISN